MMIVFQDENGTTVHRNGRSLMKSMGLIPDNPVQIVDESGRLIGVGSGLAEAYESMPVIEKLRSQTMTKSLENRPLMTKSHQGKPLGSSMKEKFDELESMLKSMEAKVKKPRHCWI